MGTLLFDGDKQRIYEVPDGPRTITLDANGYRTYTPDTPSNEPPTTSYTAIELWSQWVDYHHTHQWAHLCFDRSGGEFRESTDFGDIFAGTELRFTNNWHLVPANYDHIITLDGNFLPNLNTSNHFDTERLTQPVEVKVLFADRGTYVRASAQQITLDTNTLATAIANQLNTTGTTTNPWDQPTNTHTTPGTFGHLTQQTNNTTTKTKQLTQALLALITTRK